MDITRARGIGAQITDLGNVRIIVPESGMDIYAAGKKSFTISREHAVQLIAQINEAMIGRREYRNNRHASIDTECGYPLDGYDTPGDYKINGHYHYANGACDDEPSYANGGPA